MSVERKKPIFLTLKKNNRLINWLEKNREQIEASAPASHTLAEQAIKAIRQQQDMADFFCTPHHVRAAMEAMDPPLKFVINRKDTFKNMWGNTNARLDRLEKLLRHLYQASGVQPPNGLDL